MRGFRNRISIEINQFVENSGLHSFWLNMNGDISGFIICRKKIKAYN